MSSLSISDFEILDVISTKGKKNNIRIYKARQKGRNSSDICLKTFTSPKFALVQEALNEAKLLLSASAQHQNICQMQDCFIEHEQDFFRFGIVMEYFPDGDLEDEIKRRKRKKMHWSNDEFYNISDGLIDALSVLQSNQICHRDLKPQNIFMSSNTDFKIGDFGLSKKDSFSGSCTRTLVGTPIYFSPICAKSYIDFQMNGNETSVHCNMFKNDVFSLGLTFLRMASLKSIRGLNTKSQEIITQRIDNLNYSEAIRGMLFHMLQVKECDRPDFLHLKSIMRELSNPILTIQPIENVETQDEEEEREENNVQINEITVKNCPKVDIEIIEEYKKINKEESDLWEMETEVSESDITELEEEDKENDFVDDDCEEGENKHEDFKDSVVMDSQVKLVILSKRGKVELMGKGCKFGGLDVNGGSKRGSKNTKNISFLETVPADITL
ncbi:unnamed protein product [Blepharisma stoltei]|uniref:Protein kinase domain-containing protein n=1 Tax=Blepharisma stoltei TaxID=1481888 RepID=A0AAU9JZW1_9CILI|nr:unnamed protein product [Blepharisma stoltei]